MMNVATYSKLSAGVSVQTPSILLPLFNCFADIFVAFDFHAFVFFHLHHLFIVSTILTGSFALTATCLWAPYSGSFSAICLMSLRYCLKALRPFLVSASAVCGFLSMNSLVISTYPASSNLLR